MPDTPQNPYVGPRPFERQDSHRFFGRDREANELLSLIVANRVVVLYAESGAGKTSLLNAQVTPLLEAEGFEVLPFARVQGPLISGIDPHEIANIYTFYTLLNWSGEHADTTAVSRQTISEHLQNRPHKQDEFGDDQPRVVIFDQFEELFTAYPGRWAERESFFNQISRALEDDSLLRVVFSLRADYVTLLDPYAHLLPRNLRTRFRLERMRPSAALDAIRRPIINTPRNFEPGVAEQLVEDLRAIRVESVSGEITTVTGEFVEPVQLQVVLQNLWEDLPATVTAISQSDLQTFGDVDQALSNFYERALTRALTTVNISEEALRQWFETTLITPVGTRGTVHRGAQETAGIPNTAVQTLEDMHIIRGEYRAGSRWYELTHDRLIEPILNSNKQWLYERQQARIQRIRRLAFTAVGIVALIALCGYLFLYIQSTLLAPTGSDAMEVAGMRETAVSFEATATVVQAIATAQVNLNAQYTREAEVTATAFYEINSTATAQTNLIATAIAQTAVAQATLDAEATTTAEARATVDAQATQTANELAQLRQPIRPLRPGISIGSIDSGTAGTLGAFVRDQAGVVYLLGPRSALGSFSVPVLQPSPIDGGRIENAIAQAVGPAPQTAISAPAPLDPDRTDANQTAAQLLTLATLNDDISFEQTIPGVSEIIGVREPVDGTAVTIVGRTSGTISGILQACPNTCQLVNFVGETTTSPYQITAKLATGDEGALVLDSAGYALGIVAQIGPDTSLIVSLPYLLQQFNVTLATDSPLLAEFIYDQPVHAVAYNPNGRQLVVAGNNQHLYAYDPANLFTPPVTLGNHLANIRALAFSLDGATLASGDVNGQINLWNPTQPGRATATRTDHQDSVRTLQFARSTLASGSWDGSAIIWEVFNPSHLVYLSQYFPSPATDQIVWDVAFSPNGRFLLSGQRDGTASLWNIGTPTNPTQLWNNRSHTGQTIAVAYASDGTQFATAGSEGSIYLYSTADDSYPIFNEYETDGDVIWDIQFSPDNRYLAAATKNGRIYLWDHTDHTNPIIWDGHVGDVYGLAFNPDGNTLTTVGADGAVRIWLLALLQ